MVQAAVYMKNKLVEEKILDTAFKRNLERHTDTYHLVLVGHSLGKNSNLTFGVKFVCWKESEGLQSVSLILS